jgi:hypothetical protein
VFNLNGQKVIGPFEVDYWMQYTLNGRQGAFAIYNNHTANSLLVVYPLPNAGAAVKLTLDGTGGKGEAWLVQHPETAVQIAPGRRWKAALSMWKAVLSMSRKQRLADSRVLPMTGGLELTFTEGRVQTLRIEQLATKSPIPRGDEPRLKGSIGGEIWGSWWPRRPPFPILRNMP